jgi:16S rRNA (cytosine967-C5)-methyltransferase
MDNTKPRVSPARSAAFDILLRVEQQDSYASELLHAPRNSQLSPSDHRLATELVMGVLRWRSSLDSAIARVSAQPLNKIDTEVLAALRLGAYQILFLDRVPNRAAIHESVELTKQARKRSAASFVNAILRKLTLSSPGETPQDDDSAPGMAQHYSHPEWLVARWNEHYGPEATQKICIYDQQVPRTAIRLRDSSVENELRGRGVELAASELLSSARIVVSGEITSTSAFQEGGITIQDQASQLVALLVGGGQILDCCAAPGGKTAVIAERNPASEITAVELHPHRARLLRKLVPAPNVRIVTADARHLPLSLNFNSVLVDAPCSGTGTLARNPEIKWRLEPKDLRDLHSLQVQILRSAADRTLSRGRMVYATCSLEPEENAEVIEQFLAESPSFQPLDCRQLLERLKSEGELTWQPLESLLSGSYLRTIPGVHPCDGFFAAILERN